MPIRTFDLSQPVDAYYAAKDKKQAIALDEYNVQRQAQADERAATEFQQEQEARPGILERQAQDRAVEDDKNMAAMVKERLLYVDPDAPDFQEKMHETADELGNRMTELGYSPRQVSRAVQRAFTSGVFTPERVRMIQEKEGVRRKPEDGTLIVGLLDKYYTDPESLSAREKAILKSKGKLPSGESLSGAIGSLAEALTPTTGAKTAIQKDLVAAEKAILGNEAVEKAALALPDEAFQVLPRVMSEVKNWGEKLDLRPTTPAEKKFRGALTDFAVTTGRSFDAYRKQITGAQAGMQEIRMLEKRVPVGDGMLMFDSKVDLMAKIKANKEFFAATSKRLKDILASGFTIAKNDDGEFYGFDPKGNLVDLAEKFPIAAAEGGFEYVGAKEAKGNAMKEKYGLE